MSKIWVGGGGGGETVPNLMHVFEHLMSLWNKVSKDVYLRNSESENVVS